MLSSQSAQVVSDIGLAKTRSALPPSGAACTLGCVFSLALLRLSDGHEGCSGGSQWPVEPARPHSLCLHIGAVCEPCSPRAVSPPSDPRSAPAVSRHVFGRRSRPATKGFHARRREDFAWSHFFPRSVGFGPTASSAIGAFTMPPSMLCQDQAMPSISSYSARPLRHSRTKTPFRFHSKKYLCTELALPNSLFGNAFHWQPVRKTYTIADSTFRGSMAFRPPPARRKYVRLLSRLGFGISGSARFQNSSEMLHDLKAFMAWNRIKKRRKLQYIIYG